MIFDLISEALITASNVIVYFLGSIINNIFEAVYDLNQALGLDALTDYISSVAVYFIIFIVSKQGLSIYVLQTEGDPEEEPIEFISRGLGAVCMAYCGSWLFKYVIRGASAIAKDLLGLLSIGTIGEQSKVSLTDLICSTLISGFGESSDLVEAGLVASLTQTAMLIYLVIFCFQAGKRGAELMLGNVLLPLFSADLATASRERWNAFFWEMFKVTFGYIVQSLCMLVAFQLLKMMKDNFSFIYVIAAFGWFRVMIKSPKWLEKFLYSQPKQRSNALSSAVNLGLMLRR